MILIASILLILGEAIPEALTLPIKSFRGNKTLAGTIEFVYRAVITVIVFLWIGCENIYFVLGGYLLLRFAIFDFIYNLTAGLKLTYIGKTKLSDKFWQWFFKVTRFPVGAFFGMLKLICFLIGLTWLIQNR